jgi:hypothetical protein
VDPDGEGNDGELSRKCRRNVAEMSPTLG